MTRLSRRKVLRVAGAAGISSLALGNPTIASAQTGGPVEWDRLLTSTADIGELQTGLLNGAVTDRPSGIDNIDVPVAVGQRPSTTGQYLVINDPNTAANADLTAVEVASGGSWAQADNVVLVEDDAVVEEFTDSEIEVGEGESWVPILDASAIPDSVVDNYDDPYQSGETLSNYYTAMGTFGNYSIQSNVSVSGSALEYNGNTGLESIYSLNTDGLPNYPAQGDRFILSLYFDSSTSLSELGRFGPNFGVQDSTRGDSYVINISTRGSTLSLQRVDNDSPTTLDSTTLNGGDIPTGAFTRFDVHWQSDGAITVDWQENSTGEWQNIVPQLSATDSTYTDGGIGYIHGGVGDTNTVRCFWDDWLVDKGGA